MRLNLPLEAPLSDVYPEAETHRLRCGRVVPRVSVDVNCGIRVQWYRQADLVSRANQRSSSLRYVASLKVLELPTSETATADQSCKPAASRR
jgi:hypothetical protein